MSIPSYSSIHKNIGRLYIIHQCLNACNTIMSATSPYIDLSTSPTCWHMLWYPFHSVSPFHYSHYTLTLINCSLQSIHNTLISFVALKLFIQQGHWYFLVLVFPGCIVPAVPNGGRSNAPSLLISKGFCIPFSSMVDIKFCVGDVTLQPMYFADVMDKSRFSASSLKCLLWYLPLYYSEIIIVYPTACSNVVFPFFHFTSFLLLLFPVFALASFHSLQVRTALALVSFLPLQV